MYTLDNIKKHKIIDEDFVAEVCQNKAASRKTFSQSFSDPLGFVLVFESKCVFGSTYLTTF